MNSTGPPLNQPDWQSLLQSGIAAVNNRNGKRALDFLTRARRLDPENAEIRYWLGNAHRLCRQSQQAETLFRELLSEAPADERAGFALAYLLRENGHPKKAADALVGLSRHHERNLQTLLRITGFLRDSNQFHAAIEVLQNALKHHAVSADLHFKLSRLHQAVGQFPQALEQLRTTLQLDPDAGSAWLSLAHLQRFSDKDSEDFRLIEQALARPSGNESAMCLAFAHAKALDDLGQWQQAWLEYERGNRLRQMEQPWSRERWQTIVETVCKDRFQPEQPALPQKRHPVFIVGMLRSGTTLLEQLLSRHNRIHGRGELNFLAHLAAGFQPGAAISATQKQALADELWTHMRLDGPEQDYYIDKNPLNFRFLGFLLRIMPQAHILHVRRDGRDSCLSCFFQLFQHADAGFSNSLGDLQHYFQGYRQIMDHWRSRMDGQIHEVSYERLVRSPAEELDSIQRFLGLERKNLAEINPDEPGVIRTASSWQARQKLHQRSIGRWRNYQPMAPEFFNAIYTMDDREKPA